MRFSSMFVASLLAHAFLQAQTPQPSQRFEIQEIDSTKPKNYWVVDLTKPARKEQATDTLRVIVRLQASPQHHPGARQSSALVHDQHKQFKSDLARLTGSVGRNRNGASIQTIIHHEYTRAFNGFALTTSRRMAEDIRGLSYVLAVTEDKKVEASYSENNGLIRAPQAWQDFGVTGKNIVIGILDTGIDYNHPDLGQGFGPGFKVQGGYDFVNNDNDPLDDHGHGTHVAGIAAANGLELKGVAPDAKLVAYKVLNNGGWGYDSWILAGIERTVDPDQNPVTDDALDVVNMSLGRVPEPGEPLSEAVNNAVASGVVFCVAAGNRGDYFTIDTPGVAENAITVGATDNYKNTAYFSSKGPTENLRAKPDVSAPGMDINSTFLNQQYQVNSGTSMASPHVAGAVALLLEKNPEWTPEMVKNALMGSARSISPFVWDQGAGVIDVYNALKVSYVSSPGSLNFGSATSASPLGKTVTLTVTNTGDAPRTFQLSAEGQLNQPPFSLSISPASFVLNGNETRTIDISLSSATPIPLLNLPEAYTSSINIESDGMISRTSAVLVNPQKTVVNFTGEVPNNIIVVGIEGSWYWKPFAPQAESTSLELYLPKAKYDFITHYEGGLKTVITEGVDTEENVEITLDKALAKNILAFKPLDVDGNAIDLTNSLYGGAFFSGEDRNIVTLFTGPVDTIHVSDMEHYKYEFKYNGPSASGNEYYDVIAGTETGIGESKVYSNDPASFAEITIHNPSVAPEAKQHLTVYSKTGAPYFWSTSWNSFPFEYPSTFKLLQTQRPAASGFLGLFVRFSPLPEQPGYVWETSDIRAEEGDQISFYQHIDRKIVTIEEKDLEFVLGKTIPVFNLYPDHQESVARYGTFLGRGAFNHVLGERERGSVNFKLYQGDAVIKEGLLKQSIYTESESYFPDVPVTSGIYNLDFEYRDFQTGGKFGIAKLSTVFDMQAYDRNPPILKTLRLLADGKDTNEFAEGANAVINFSIVECEFCTFVSLQHTSLSIKHADAAQWTSLSLAEDNSQFSAVLPPDLPAGYYSLQLKAEDFAGNKITYDISPGFLVGERVQPVPYTIINLIAPKNNSANAGPSPLFRWSPTDAHSYLIQIADNPAFSGNIVEGISTTASYVLPSPLEENRTFYWRVKEIGDNTSGLWSSVYQFDSKFLPAASLLTPAHQSTVPYASLDLTWGLVQNAYRYVLEVSVTEDFSNLHRIEYTGATTVNVVALYPNTRYYWRVKSFFFLGWEDEESVSAAFEFTTQPLASPTWFYPANQAVDQPLNMDFQWGSVDWASGYYFELSRKEDFSSLVHTQTALSSTTPVQGLQPEQDYYWRVTPQYYDIPQLASQINSFRTGTITAIEQSEGKRGAYAYPNPFAEGTDIVIFSEHHQDTQVQIVDPLGRKVKIFASRLFPGKNTIHWDGDGPNKKFGTGVYYAMISGKNTPPVVVRLVKTM